MFDFNEYCEIYEFLTDKGIFEQNKKQSYKSKKVVNLLDTFSVCALVNDIQEDDAYFETLINQIDLDALNRLLPYFAEGGRIAKTIHKRIGLLRKYGRTAQKTEKQTEEGKENVFFPYLCEWIDKKGFASDSDFYNHAGISRQSFSKLRNNKVSVTREMALHLAVSLELDYEECVEFLKHLGYSLNSADRREQIISYILRKRKYTFHEMEELLYIFGEKTFLRED